MSSDFLTLLQAAERLQVSETTMRRYLKAGKVPALKIGRDWRVPVSALTALAESALRASESASERAAPPPGSTPAAAKRRRK